MVVCKCRKATNLYCFVHKVPVCGECVCSAEHQICVVRTYSEWVIDGDYDWPPECTICHQILQAAETSVTRLGCLHVLHSPCFSKHLQNFPPHTAPAGYTCPDCLIPIWPPKQVKDQTCALSSQLKDAISQSGLSKTLLGNDISSLQQATPPTFASNSTGPTSEPEIKEEASGVNGQSHSINIDALSMMSSPQSLQPGAMTRKASARADRSGLSHVGYNGEDEEEIRKKYNHPGPLQKQAMKYLLPFSSNNSTVLPVTTPSRKDDQGSYAEEVIEGRHRRKSRSSGLNTKKILLLLAIMSCMATMLLLYYRLLQGTPSEDMEENNQNHLQ